LDSDRDFAHVEKLVRAHEKIFTVDKYQNIMTKSQTKHPPIVTRMADKFVDIKTLPAELGLNNNKYNTE
jgi:hypothetical protein